MSWSHPPTSVWLILKRFAGYGALFLLITSLVSVLLLRFLPVPTTAFMIHRHIDDVIEGRAYTPIAHQWVAYENISPAASRAVIASEDQLFYQHFGFDLDAINRAVDNYLEGGSLRGASTISQQVAKNLFLSPTKRFWRKGLEVWFTGLLELFWSKQRILEVYLNSAEFGDHLFGIEAASRHYFGIPAQRLSPAQAALLAATLPNPLRLRADKPSAYVLRRQAWILRQMRNLPEHQP